MVAGYVDHAGRRWCSCGGRCPATIPSAGRPRATYMVTIGVAQVGWIALVIVGPADRHDVRAGGRAVRARARGPFIAERKGRHAVEPAPHRRALRAAGDHHAGRGDHRHGRRTQRARPRRGRLDASTPRCSRVAGVGLTFGCWWMYFAVPWANRWSRHRERAFLFGYGHIVIFAAAGRDGRRPARRRLRLEGEAEIGDTGDGAQRRDPGRDLRRSCSTRCTRC